MDVIEPEELSCLKDQFVNLDELKEDVKMKMNVCWRRKDTLTEDGRREWSDVLNAKVTSIYEGHYGVQIGLTGCPAERCVIFLSCWQVTARLKIMTVG